MYCLGFLLVILNMLSNFSMRAQCGNKDHRYSMGAEKQIDKVKNLLQLIPSKLKFVNGFGNHGELTTVYQRHLVFSDLKIVDIFEEIARNLIFRIFQNMLE